MPDLDTAIAGCAQAHRRLRETLGGLDDDVARGPSRLPDWTVGHILTHIARNADSHVRILQGALAGEHLEQYEGGHEQRSGDIEAGAGRGAGELVDDVITTFVRLEDTFERMTPEAWDGWGLSRGQPWPCRDVPFFRWREVEVHHVDLGMGYDVVDWPDGYVAAELPIALSALPLRITDPSARGLLLGWLLGRNEQPQSIELQPWSARRENYLVPPGWSAP
jgi:maleylpyruvate isomerase